MINLSEILHQKFNTLWNQLIRDLYINNEDFANSMPDAEIILLMKAEDDSNNYKYESEYIQMYLEKYVKTCNNSWTIISNSINQGKRLQGKPKLDDISLKPNVYHYTINLPQVSFHIGKKYKATWPWKDINSLGDYFVNYYKNGKIDADIKDIVNNEHGGLDITFNTNFIMTQLYDLCEKSYQLEVSKSETIIVDFSSPNMAKKMHLGHLRSTIIGDVICRFFEFRGHHVHRINHLGDWGRPFAITITYLLDHQEEFDKNPTVETLQDFYVKGTIQFTNDHVFEKLVYTNVRKLQDKDPEIYKYWKQICHISRKEIQQIYNELDIKINDIGESFYQDQMDIMISELENAGKLKEYMGMKIVEINGIPNAFILQKSIGNGGNYTYDTSDLAALKYRIDVMNADRIYYVVDIGQHNHFQLLFGVGQKVGYYDSSKIIVQHIDFGLIQTVSGGKLSTRKGGNVGLKEILEMGKEYAIDETLKHYKARKDNKKDNKIEQKELDKMSTKLSNNCIKYFELSHKRTSNYKIDYNKIFNNQGNTAVYINYAYVRLYQIWDKFKIAYPDINLNDIVLMSQHEIETNKYHSEDIEIKLIMHVLKFPEMINLMENGNRGLESVLMPHHMTDYLYELSQVVSKFYGNSKCYCLTTLDSGELIITHYSRLLLVVMTLKVMKTTLNILGIEILNKI